MRHLLSRIDKVLFENNNRTDDRLNKQTKTKTPYNRYLAFMEKLKKNNSSKIAGINVLILNFPDYKNLQRRARR